MTETYIFPWGLYHIDDITPWHHLYFIDGMDRHLNQITSYHKVIYRNIEPNNTSGKNHIFLELIIGVPTKSTFFEK